MAKIDYRKKRETSKGYSRLYENDVLGRFFTANHAATISNGMELRKKLINCYTGKLPIFYGDKVKNQKRTLDIINNTTDGCIIFSGYINDKNKNKNKNKKKEIDIIISKKNKLFIIEVKDGNALDTKKSETEIDGIEYSVQSITNLGYEDHEGKLVLMNMENYQHKIKDYRSSEYVMSGEDFCEKFQFDYKKFQECQKSDAPENLATTYYELKEIMEMLELEYADLLLEYKNTMK